MKKIEVPVLTGVVFTVKYYLVLTDLDTDNFLYVGAFGSEVLRARAERYLIKKYRKDGYTNIGVSYEL